MASRLSLVRWEVPRLAGVALLSRAGYAKKKGEGSGDGKMQLLLKVLQPQDLQPLDSSPEQLADAARRCAVAGGQGGRPPPRFVSSAALPPGLALSTPCNAHNAAPPYTAAGPRSTAG
jgi:hypothetical protein